MIQVSQKLVHLLPKFFLASQYGEYILQISVHIIISEQDKTLFGQCKGIKHGKTAT